ncbi:PadR family transcriptional regulator [Aquabacterium sp. A7-Y]|uniref:PadR family transcriptional regulator n=1 Tax=Aquabacterium sp. A7-Y TaxID=1349605 RepID=UPI00223E4710|nr:PadR family transcriptional regulator [Aquabacterium sp. A7-Y]MCW7540119.1 PadR family transcriptional regulator [Aquabacterium sp. A7-Y]
MSLPHALLTSLMEKSSSGYDLAQRFDKSIGHFWHATHQQIYRELARMEERGWIASKPAADAGKTRKREYRVLPRGRAELARWANEAGTPLDLRDALMVKVRAAAALPGIELDGEIEDRLQGHAQQLAHYREIEQRDFPSPDTTRTQRLQHLLLRRGILYEEASIAWLKELQNVLRQKG